MAIKFILGHNIHIASIRVTLQHFSYLLHRPSLLLELGVSNWWLLLKRQEMFVKQYCLFPFETFSEKKTAKIGLILFSPRGVTLSIFFSIVPQMIPHLSAFLKNFMVTLRGINLYFSLTTRLVFQGSCRLFLIHVSYLL